MDMLAYMSDSLAALHELSKKDTIFLDDVQKEFRPDIQAYITGATLSIKNGKIVIGNNLYKAWLNKIRTKGFDEEIDFKKSIISQGQLPYIVANKVDDTSTNTDANQS